VYILNHTYWVNVLKLQVTAYLALHLHKLLQTESLPWLPANAVLPPLLTEAKELKGAQHCSPGQSGALYYFWNTSYFLFELSLANILIYIKHVVIASGMHERNR